MTLWKQQQTCENGAVVLIWFHPKINALFSVIISFECRPNVRMWDDLSFLSSVIAAPVRHHTHTYPGVATTSPVVPAATMVTPGVPVVNSGGLIDTSAVHHIHHIPGGKSRTRRDREMSSEESDSDEPVPRRYLATVQNLFLSTF